VIICRRWAEDANGSGSCGMTLCQNEARYDRGRSSSYDYELPNRSALYTRLIFTLEPLDLATVCGARACVGEMVA